MKRNRCLAVLAVLYGTALSSFASAWPAADTIRDTLNPNIQYGVAGIKGRVLDKGYYVINYCDRWRIPYWSAYYLTAKDVNGKAKRKSSFRPDLDGPENARSTLEDYRGKTFDRGHLAPAGVFKRSKEAMSATFVLSNVSPQHPNTNRGIWRDLERQIRNIVKDRDEAWVVTGDAFMSKDSQAASPTTWIGRDGQNRVAVPTHLFDAILTRDAEGRWQAYAFLVPNQPAKNPDPVSRYLITVDRLEQIVAFDFFVGLDTAQQNRIESVLPAWPW